MSFFDKLFSHKNRHNKIENAIKTETEILSFRSSHLSILKDQIRFILFRECDRRGRKLLFDSNAVEKIPLPSREVNSKQKHQTQSNERIIDFIETTSTHGYKYKKPSSDVSGLGEMIFGSVAMVYKGESSYKIHSIPSPKQLMFTTIVHAPVRCLASASECSAGVNSRGSSLASLNEIINQKPTSSSDSKLYNKQSSSQKISSTYPWIKPSSPLSKITQCCEISDLETALGRKNYVQLENEVKCLGSLCSGNRCSSSIQEDKGCVEKLRTTTNFSNFNENNSSTDFEKDSNIGTSVVTSLESEYVSSGSSSLSSLRRRWVQSHATSLDSVVYEDSNCSPSKKKTKLGMAIILDLTNTLEEEMEKFLFNHTIVIDSIMSKLQSSVELAYVKNENFVDLIYTAFQESQESIFQLITSGKYETPIWYLLAGNSDECLESPFMARNKLESSIRTGKRQDLLESVQLKFLNDFCDVLEKFDTKDTNFFISTLLTAVLTHHLSWVTSIAETDSITSHQELSVIKSTRPYNPIWAQLNDLCGLLGSPLKCAKTVITGPESKKCHIANIVQILTYFIRCYDVVENIYDVDIEDIINNADLEGKKLLESIDLDIDSDDPCSSNLEDKSSQVKVTENETSTENRECFRKIEKETLLGKEKLIVRGGGLKRSKSYLSHLEMDTSSRTNKLYPDIKDLAKSENVNVSDLNEVVEERTALESAEAASEKVKKIITVPDKSLNAHLEGYLSPDEGYDTIDSSKTDSIRADNVQMDLLEPVPSEKKEDIVFVLGDNEKLVNLPKKVVVTKSSVIEMEKQDPKECFQCDPVNSENQCDKNNRTFHNISDRTFNKSNYENNIIKHSRSTPDPKRNTPCTVPLMIRELKMPRVTKPCRRRRLEVSSVLGGVNEKFNSEQIIQGVTEPRSHWEHLLRKDLFLRAHSGVLEKNINEALCIVGDMNSWEVSLISSNTSVLERSKHKEVNVGMSQLVADMLESFLYLHKINLSPSFCLLHMERKLHEIYSKSKTVAEFLNTTELCSIDYLTTRLDIGINDVPLLLSVATTHSPHISEKYGLSFS